MFSATSAFTFSRSRLKARYLAVKVFIAKELQPRFKIPEKAKLLPRVLLSGYDSSAVEGN